ncbi:hypothetical protein ACPFL9_20425 [Paenarthrobacter sp. NyZ202]|uniref:hypothetical protein n=1 Tax=Paenarthrobacter sp. NyZ202 TaxID=3402689 RepID=UPI003CF95628
MAWGKSEEQKQAERALKDQAAYAASPMGRAEAAHRNGDGFFQLELPVSQVRNSRVFPGAAPGGLLGQIEAVGWRLEHAGFVFLQTDSSTTPGIFQGTEGQLEGDVMGIYLFRRAAPSS